MTSHTSDMERAMRGVLRARWLLKRRCLRLERLMREVDTTRGTCDKGAPPAPPRPAANPRHFALG